MRAISESTWKCSLLQRGNHLLLLAMVEALRAMQKEEIFFPPRFLEPDNWRFLCVSLGRQKVSTEILALLFTLMSGGSEEV